MKTRRIAAALLAAAAVFTAAVPKAMADDDEPTGAKTITGTYGNPSEANTSFSFNKYLVLDKNANVPNTEFTFAIEPDSDVENPIHLTETNVELYQGITTEADNKTYPLFSDGSAVFTDETPVNEGGVPAEFTDNKGDADTIKIVDDTSKKYAVDGLTLDFSNVEFLEPGVYRYKITETVPSTGSAYTPKTETERTLDVYVIDTNDAKTESTYTKLAIQGYVLYDKVLDSTAAPLNYSETAAVEGIGYNESEVVTASGKKSSGFVNEYDTHNLTIGKEVSGNQASKDKYFKFTVKIENAVEGDVYTVAVEKSEEDVANGVFANADPTVIPNNATTVSGNNVKSIEVKEGGVAEQDFYLHDGQYLTICGLGKGVKYTVTEDSEKYTKVEKITEELSSLDWDASSEGYDALDDDLTGNIADADIHTGFTNTRNGSIPTGVLLSVAAPAVIGIGVLGGIIFLAVKRSRKDDDEDE